MSGIASHSANRMKSVRALARTLFNLVRFPLALLHYRRTGRTQPWAHQSLVQLFCATGGRFNDVLSGLIGRRRRLLDVGSPIGVLGDLGGEAMAAPLEQLRQRGYVAFPSALDAAMCERLMNFALCTPAVVRRMDHEPDGRPARTAYFDPEHPLAVRYDYPTEALLNNTDVQALLADPSLLALAQRYLGSRPRADVLSMWWHTNFHAQPDSEAAQFYHFDLDRIKWLKVFIYLTDVGPDDGPHSFIEGSHRTGGIPGSMLRRGYVRLADEEVLAHYGRDRQVEFAAPRGTVIVEDTRGLHKGKAVRDRARLILQLQFSNSLFGASYERASLKQVSDEGLARLIEHSRDVYAQYLEPTSGRSAV